jgi:hypothetical protein
MHYMNCICNLFKKKQPPPKAAGLLFSDAIHVLAGWQPTKKIPIISGFGGSLQSGEDWQTAAVRETLEELFDIESPPPELITQIKETLFSSSSRQHVYISENYTYTTLYFSDLITILNLTSDSGIQSPIYPRGIPLTINDLIFNRIFTPKSEVQQLILLPVDHNIKLDPYFIEDINKYGTA